MYTRVGVKTTTVARQIVDREREREGERRLVSNVNPPGSAEHGLALPLNVLWYEEMQFRGGKTQVTC